MLTIYINFDYEKTHRYNLHYIRCYLKNIQPNFYVNCESEIIAMKLSFTALACLISVSVFGQLFNVTFQVDMNQFDEPFNYENVYLNSSFDGWCGACRQMYNMNNDNIWSVIIPLNAGTYEYKFTLDGWTDQEWFASGENCTTTIDGFVNRTVTVSDEDLLIPVVCYGKCNACIISVYGCTYESATNYNELATVDDLSCEFENIDVDGCNSDLNNDDVISTADLLLFLVSFGQLCE